MTDMTPRPVIDSMLDAIITVGKDAQALSYNGDTWDNIERRARERLYKAVDGQRTLDTPVMERLRTQADTPQVAPGPDVYPLVGNPTPWRVRTVTIPSWRGPGQPKAIRHELLNDNGRIVGNIRNEGVAHEVVRLVNSGGAVALELVDKYHAQKLELENVREALRIESKAAHAARVAIVAAENIRAAQVDRLMGERDEALTERDEINHRFCQLQASMLPHPDHSRLAELEARNVELRQMLEQAQERLETIERDRDGYKRGAQFWMDSSKEKQAERDTAEAKLAKLRTFLQGVVAYPMNGDLNSINHILEETK